MTFTDIYRHPRAALRALQAWLLRRRVIPPLPYVDPRPTPAPVTRKSREEREALEDAANLAGSFYFREQILDDLDYYMTCIKRMRKADPEAYVLYSQLGAHLLPRGGEIVSYSGLSPWWKVNRPGFGAVAATHGWLDEINKKEKVYTPRFWYFQKLKTKQFLRNRVVQVPPLGSDIYRITAYWDQPRDKEWKEALPSEFLIAITPDYRVFPLKERTTRWSYPVSKRKRWDAGQQRGRRDNEIASPRWDIHSFFKDWAKEHDRPVEDFMAGLFFCAASMYESGNRGMVRVEASRGGNAAVFSVDIKRTLYFFKDRGVTLNERGNRRRIFHIVRPHERVNGAVVPMHFRGERHFDWNGFGIRITVPGLHHMPLTEFTPAAVDYTGKVTPPNMISQKQVGEWLHGGVAALDELPNSMKNEPVLPPVPKAKLQA